MDNSATDFMSVLEVASNLKMTPQYIRKLISDNNLLQVELGTSGLLIKVI